MLLSTHNARTHTLASYAQDDDNYYYVEDDVQGYRYEWMHIQVIEIHSYQLITWSMKCIISSWLMNLENYTDDHELM